MKLITLLKEIALFEISPKNINQNFVDNSNLKKSERPLRVKLLNPKLFDITPEDLNIGDNLDLGNTKITFLPDGLKVGGGLYVNGTQITSLPNGLEVKNSLSISSTKISSLPKDLKVGGDLYLFNTPLSSKTEAEIRQMAPNIKGKIIGLKKSL